MAINHIVWYYSISKGSAERNNKPFLHMQKILIERLIAVMTPLDALIACKP